MIQSARQVMNALRAYDVMPHNPLVVDQMILPDLQARLEGFFSRSRRNMMAYHFQESLLQMWREALVYRDIINVQDLKVLISKDPAVTITIEWKLLHSVGTRSIKVQTGLCLMEVDARLHRAHERLASIAQYVEDLDRGKHE